MIEHTKTSRIPTSGFLQSFVEAALTQNHPEIGGRLKVKFKKTSTFIFVARKSGNIVAAEFSIPPFDPRFVDALADLARAADDILSGRSTAHLIQQRKS